MTVYQYQKFYVRNVITCMTTPCVEVSYTYENGCSDFSLILYWALIIGTWASVFAALTLIPRFFITAKMMNQISLMSGGLSLLTAVLYITVVTVWKKGCYDGDLQTMLEQETGTFSITSGYFICVVATVMCVPALLFQCIAGCLQIRKRKKRHSVRSSEQRSTMPDAMCVNQPQLILLNTTDAPENAQCIELSPTSMRSTYQGEEGESPQTQTNTNAFNCAARKSESHDHATRESESPDHASRAFAEISEKYAALPKSEKRPS